MESHQAYYLNKLRTQQKTMPIQARKDILKKISISWALEAMKTVLGYEDIRNIIIEHYYPQIENPHEMRTFDAFQQFENPPFIDKAMEITDYCEEIIEDDGITGIIVMTAANIQLSEDDNLTHYQSFIIDKDAMTVNAIDPAAKANGVGIYEAAISKTIIFPIFRSHNYDCKFINLSHPAQTNKGDIFCQTWTLVILLKSLEKIYKKNNKNKFIGVIDIPAPKPKVNKYRMLLDFFKDILENVPDVGREISIEYLDVVNMNKTDISEYCSFEKIVEVDVAELFMSMTAEDMMD